VVGEVPQNVTKCGYKLSEGVSHHPGVLQMPPRSRRRFNLGAVALRTGRRILFDPENMKITNIPEANKYLFREYRKGWEL
jgi:hypothetical protein